MDEFGVLTERYGIKPQGKSAPMAASKRSVNPNNGQSWNFGTGTGVHAKSKTSFSGNGSVYGGDDIFLTSRSGANSSGFNDFDVFSGLTKSSSGNTKSSLNDDLFSGFGYSGKKTSSSPAYGFDTDDLFHGSNTSASVKNDDIFGSFSSSEKQFAAVDDLLGLGKNDAGFDGLIPGFGASAQPSTTSSKTTTSNFDAADPFVVLESTTSGAHSSSGLFVDPLEEFAASVSSQGKKTPNNLQTFTKLKPPPKPTQKVDRG